MQEFDAGSPRAGIDAACGATMVGGSCLLVDDTIGALWRLPLRVVA